MGAPLHKVFSTSKNLTMFGPEYCSQSNLYGVAPQMKNAKSWNKYVIRKDGTDLYCDGNTNPRYVGFGPLEKARLFTRLNYARTYVTRMRVNYRRQTEKSNRFNPFTGNMYEIDPTSDQSYVFPLEGCSIVEVVLVAVDEIVHPLTKP